MTSFSKKAKAEAAKYKHQISPKARHKYTFNCGIGSKGFEPGNDCAGGKGKFDPTDWENTTFEERIIHKEPRGNHEVRLSDTEGPPIQERVEVVERFIDVVGKDRFLVSDKGVIFEGLTRNAAKLLSQEFAKIIPSYLIDVMENGSDVYSKDGKKRTFASDCGAGKQGSKGFQPGNTCGGDGDGKNDAGDQGGGDKSSMWNNLDKFSDQEIGRMVSDNAPELEKDELEKLVAEGKKRGLIRDEVTAENILEQPGFADDAPAAGDAGKDDLSGMSEDLLRSKLKEQGFDEQFQSEFLTNRELMEAALLDSTQEDQDLRKAEAQNDWETKRQEIDDLEDSGEISSQDAAGLRDDLDAETGMGGYAPPADDIASEQAKMDAEIAELRQQIAEQKAVADAEIAEAYKDVTEEDIQDMLEERDITAAEAEEMRGWVAQAQAAQADAPAADDADDSEFGPDDVLPRASEEAGLRQDQEYIDSLASEDAGDVRPVKPSSNVMSDGTHAIDHQAYQDYVSELSDEELSYIRIDARESMQANPDGLKAGYYADEVNYVEMEMAERMKDSAQADAPAAEGETMEAMERRRAELNDTSAADEVVETLELDTMETSQWERLKKTAEEAAPTGQRGYLTPEDMRSGGVIDKLIDAGALRHTGSGYYEIAEDLSAAKREMEDSRARQRDEDEAADAGDVSALSESELEEVLGPGTADYPLAELDAQVENAQKNHSEQFNELMTEANNQQVSEDVLERISDWEEEYSTQMGMVEPENFDSMMGDRNAEYEELKKLLGSGADAPEAQGERPKYYSDTQIWDVLEDIDSNDVYGGQTTLQQSLGSSLHEYANPDGSISSADVQNVLDKAIRTLSLQIAPSFQTPGMYDKMQELMKLYTEMHPAAPEDRG
tara:strand:+ start:4067 stop:6742 length:2676 start_codon:yes stop_codon:yes gene_type:complete